LQSSLDSYLACALHGLFVAGLVEAEGGVFRNIGTATLFRLENLVVHLFPE
jgi:hypothetical protein